MTLRSSLKKFFSAITATVYTGRFNDVEIFKRQCPLISPDISLNSRFSPDSAVGNRDLSPPFSPVLDHGRIGWEGKPFNVVKVHAEKQRTLMAGKDIFTKMSLKNILVVALVSVTSIASGGEQKRIIIAEENNPVLSFDYRNSRLPDSINVPEFSELRKYVLSKIRTKATKEPEIYFELMGWVSRQWKHNSWHAAPKSMDSLDILKSVHDEGQVYRCVEYGLVLRDILTAFGYPSRTVGLKHVDVDYGGAGMGHVVTEVWSNNLRKWVFLDPQFGIYARRDNEILNIYDIYNIKLQGCFDEIKFIEVQNNTQNRTYGEEFLSRYLGYMDIGQDRNGLKYSLALKMEGQRDFLTFQAFPAGGMVFTEDVADLYYNLNQTMVIINYDPEEIERSKSAFAELDIKTLEEFNRNMPIFAAKPELLLSLDNNMPWFRNYLVKLNDRIIKERDGRFPVSLKEGMNVIRAVAVNQSDIEGIPTVIKVKYQ